MDAPRGTGTHGPFPVSPDDVPVSAVRAVKRTLLRNVHPGVEDPMDDDLARLVVAVVIAALQPVTPASAETERSKS